MTELRASEVLNLAADQVQVRGLRHGADGWHNTGPVCTEGALLAAAGLSASSRGDLWTCPAYVAVQSYLGLSLDHLEDGRPVAPLWGWNDKYDDERHIFIRTAGEVIEVLRAAAAIEQAREDAALLAECGRT